MALGVKNLPASAGDIRDAGSIPGLGRSPGGGKVTEQQMATETKPDLELICILTLFLEFLLKYPVQARKKILEMKH